MFGWYHELLSESSSFHSLKVYRVYCIHCDRGSRPSGLVPSSCGANDDQGKGTTEPAGRQAEAELIERIQCRGI